MENRSRSIISLVPSLTEFLVHPDINADLIGRTKFCIHPEERLKEIPAFGGTKNPKIEAIRQAKPDIVVMNREENRKEDAEAIAAFARVIITEIDTVEQALDAMTSLGALLGKEAASQNLIGRIRREIPAPDTFPPLRTAYLIWREPWMSVASETYIHDVMRIFGLENIFADQNRYPSFSPEALADLDPELVLLSSEPFPFKEHHATELRNAGVHGEILFVDGTWFSWYGSRMLEAFKAIKKWRSAIKNIPGNTP